MTGDRLEHFRAKYPVHAARARERHFRRYFPGNKDRINP